MNPRLRALLVSPTGAGELSGPDVCTALGDNPVCGDRIQLFARITAEGRVAELRYRATACAASCAVAELAARLASGLPCADASLPRAVARELDVLGGLPGRERHALDLVAEAWGRLRRS